jgi:hypothetical protein
MAVAAASAVAARLTGTRIELLMVTASVDRPTAN